VPSKLQILQLRLNLAGGWSLGGHPGMIWGRISRCQIHLQSLYILIIMMHTMFVHIIISYKTVINVLRCYRYPVYPVPVFVSTISLFRSQHRSTKITAIPLSSWTARTAVTASAGTLLFTPKKRWEMLGKKCRGICGWSYPNGWLATQVRKSEVVVVSERY
jgi:hypothetical protein